MKRWIGRITAIGILGLAFAHTGGAQTIGNNWETRYTNGIAAVVEGRIITLEELRREMAPLVDQIRTRVRSQEQFDREISALARDILQNLVDRILIIQDFQDTGYQIPPNFLENEYDDYITKEFNGDRAAFLDFLRSQGKTPRQFRADLRERIIVSFMRQNMRRTTSEVSPERIKQYHEDNRVKFMEEEAVKLRLILLTPSADESTDLLLQEANSIIGKLDDGAEFADLARTHSQDAKRRIGGDWGWVNRGDLKGELVEPAFNLDSGEYSEPIVMNGSIFILYIEEKREEGIKPLDNPQVRAEIEEFISGQMARQAQQEWLERLRKDAYIKYYLREAAETGRGPV